MNTDWLKSRRAALLGSRPAQESFNILVYGPIGTGKSSLIVTCRQPIYVFSFDPGGTKLAAMEKLESEGRAILDTQYEVEDMKHPTAFAAFDRTCDEMDKAGAWPSIGTVAVDSLTTLCDATMNFILKKEGRAGQTPQIQDYLILQTMLGQVVRRLSALPCDFVLTGHINVIQDQLTSRIMTALAIPGRNPEKIPVLFDEVLYSDVTVDAKKNVTYRLQLQGDGKHRTSTRRFSGDNFESYEVPDVMALRAKAGKAVDHLPPIM